MTNHFAKAIAVLFIGLSLMCCSRIAPTSEQPDKVSTRIKWLPGITYVGSYMAQQKGFWKEQGLDVTIRPGGFEADPLKLVASDSDQFGITGSEQLLQARAEGLPVVAIYMELAYSPAGWMAKKSTGIARPQDFPGRRVGAQYGTNIEPTLDALLGKLGIDPKTLKRIPVKYDLVPFYNDQVDVMPVYLTGQPVLARMEGYDINTIDPAEYGIQLYGNVYFTSEKLIKERPELVQRFVNGLLRGWREAIGNPKGAVEVMIQAEPKLDPVQEEAFFAATQPFVKDRNQRPLGVMSRERWEETMNLMQKYGGLRQDLSIDASFTNRFVDEAHRLFPH